MLSIQAQSFLLGETEDRLGFCSCVDDDFVTGKMKALFDIWVHCVTEKDKCSKIEEILENEIKDKSVRAGLIGIIYRYFHNRENAESKVEVQAPFNDDANRLLKECEWFVLMERDKEFENLKNQQYYVSLWSFIYNYLEIPADWAYVVMQTLENEQVIEHGSGIRCAWLRHHKYITDVSTENIKKKSDTWLPPCLAKMEETGRERAAARRAHLAETFGIRETK